MRLLVLARKSKGIVGKSMGHVISSKRTREQFIKTSVILYLVSENLLKKNLSECRITLFLFFLERGGHGEAFPPLAQVPSGWKIVVTAAFTVMNLADTLTNLLGFGVRRGKSFMKS
jgi:hypothetical protein